jgi:carotenoid 1,2-hydratase
VSTELAPPAPPLVLPQRPGAYAWWYFDALGDDGETAIVAIFLVGSVFSPHYAARLARGESPAPTDHVAVNLAIYRRGARPWWVFSEYDGRRLQASPRGIQVASSWFQRRADGSFLLRIDDRRVGTRRATVGEIRVSPVRAAGALTPGEVDLAGRAHRWRCVVPHARVRATFTSPALHFEGNGYHDVNTGDEPPARALTRWSWGRAHYGDRTRVFFDAEARDGQRRHLTFDTRSGRASAWLQPRALRPHLGCWLLPMPDGFHAGEGDRGERLALGDARPIERAPFYQRFVAPFPRPDGGAAVLGIGEHVDFERLAHPVVGRMIRMRLARPDRGEFGLIP